jgi:FkbH-like protein
MVTAADLRAQISKWMESGARGRARHALAARALEFPPLHEYRWLAHRLRECTETPRAWRVGLLATFTLEPISDALRAVCLAYGLDVDLYFGSFGQLEQEVMSPTSGLVAHRPDVVVVAWQLCDVSPNLHDGMLYLSDSKRDTHIESALARAKALVDSCRSNLPKTAILLHTFTMPPEPALGVIDFEHSHGQREAIEALNSGLRGLARSVHGVHLIDCENAARQSGDEWFQARHWYSAGAPLGPKALVALAKTYARWCAAIAGHTKKVLVVDLDNTLWGGTLGEDGVDGIALGPNYPGNAFLSFQREILALTARGVVLAVNSKNNESDVLEAMTNHPHMLVKFDTFAARRINWADKVSNMRDLAGELSLGLDSFVFIDDNPAELAVITDELPEVTTVQVPREPADLPGLLSRLGYFDSVQFGEEDRRRNDFYRAAAGHAELRKAHTDLHSFYRSLEMRLTIVEVSPREVPRVAQLTQRTNQFNLTTRRYTESQIHELIASPDHIVRAYRLEDRFGDQGLVAVVIVARTGTTGVIDSFLMSCRVIGRELETAILATLVLHAKDIGLDSLRGEIVFTKRNAPARDVYERSGFVSLEECPDGTRWSLDVRSAAIQVPDWITLQSRALHV